MHKEPFATGVGRKQPFTDLLLVQFINNKPQFDTVAILREGKSGQ